MIRRRVVVRGLVQGVFFRDTVRRGAISRDVTGWVRNNRDGTVEAVFEGEEADVQALVSLCGRGPRGARVEGIETFEEPPDGLSSFAVR